MLSLVLMGALGAAPTSLAALSFQTVNVSEKVGDFALQHLSERLGQLGVQVITPAEVQAVLGLERQKQLLGCSEQASECTAELANALGADASMVGTLAKLGDTIELSLKVIDSRSGRRKAGFTERVRDEAALFEVMDRAATSLAEQLRPGASATVTTSAPAAGPHLRKLTLVPAIVGGVALVTAGVSLFFANDAHQQLTDSHRDPPANPQATANAGAAWQTAAGVAGGVAVASAAVAAWFYLSGDAPPVTPVALVVDGAPALAVGGRLP